MIPFMQAWYGGTVVRERSSYGWVACVWVCGGHIWGVVRWKRRQKKPVNKGDIVVMAQTEQQLMAMNKCSNQALSF
jgi:hypothetical protein